MKSASVNSLGNDGSLYCGDMPATISWESMQDHITELKGVTNIELTTDGVTEAWIDFDFCDQHFTVNDQFGNFWFFVADPNCPKETIEAVLNHCRAGLNREGGTI